LIEEGLAGKTILITGSTGFLGKSLVEKLLRSVPSVARLNLAIRSSSRRSAQERLEREVLASPAFRRLKEELGEDAFRRLAEDKLAVLELDLGRPGLGLSEAGRAERRLLNDIDKKSTEATRKATLTTAKCDIRHTSVV